MKKLTILAILATFIMSSTNLFADGDAWQNLQASKKKTKKVEKKVKEDKKKKQSKKDK